MRPTEERSTYGYWDGDDRPDPLVAQSAPEFVSQLRTLVQWSGLRLEEIEQLARANGDILPPSIVSAALSHNTLPPEELVVALVAAIGDDDEMVELWASVLWRLEELEAATMTMAPQSAPPPEPSVSPVAGSRQYSGSALAQAVQKRQNQDSWTGLHRGFQRGLRATGFGSKFGRWPAPVAIGVAIFVLIAGVTWAVAGGGGDDDTEPQANPCCVGETGKATPSAGPSEEFLPSELPVVLPLPNGSTKASPTPKASTTPRQNPGPTQTQTQLSPSLDARAETSCAHVDSNWVITVSLTAELTGAPSGNNPQGQAGSQSIAMSGGATSFNGQGTVTIADTEPGSGNLPWSVTVSVPGASTVDDSGSASYTCT